MKAALDDVSATVQRVSASPEIHAVAKQAGVSVAEALASSLRQVADLISASAVATRPPPPRPPTDDETPADDAIPEIESSTDD